MVDATLIEMILSNIRIVTCIIYLVNFIIFKKDIITILTPLIIIFTAIMSAIISVNTGANPIIEILMIIIWIPNLYTSIKKILNKK